MNRPNFTRAWLLVWAAMLTLVGCSTSSPPPPSEQEHAHEHVHEAQDAVFVNGGFESGANNQPPPSWTVTPYFNPTTGVTVMTPQTRAGLNLQATGTPAPTAKTFTLVTAAGPESQVDPNLGATASLRWPKFGNAVAIVNQVGNGHNVNSMKQTMTIAAGDIDSLDSLAHVRMVIAPVLQDPNHNPNEQPYFFVQLTNITKGNAILYADYNFANQPGVPWKLSGTNLRYTDWQLLDIAPGSALLNIGDQVELEVIAAGCSLNAHWGQVYVDSVGSSIPGLYVTGTGPAAANANTDITYTLTYKNGGATPAVGTVVEFNTPPNTTFTSISAPGLVCTTPTAGTTGLVSCVVGALPAGGSGSFQVTVHINTGTTGVITAGNYDILATGISPLLGPKVYTNVTTGVTYADLGITVTDGATQVVWGQAVSYTVVVKNNGPNAVTGATVSDPVPANFTNMAWTCAGAGGATCPAASGTGALNQVVNLPVNGTLTYTVTGNVVSGQNSSTLFNVASVTVPAGASDPTPANNSAGDSDVILSPNGIGCTAASDCVSNICDPDNKCGHPNGTGPCTVATGAAVCRSGTCSPNAGVCIPTGGCAADNDCNNTQFCNTQTFTCTPKLPNGTQIPTIGNHTPPLTGTCTPGAGTAVCAAAVCDTNDNRCGYLNGDGPCTVATGATVCRSGTCSGVAGICIPTGGCAADSECSTTQFCNTQTFTCTPKLPNGTSIPSIGNHTPPLTGTCTVGAGAAVCTSAVCDASDNQCGYTNGNGPCTVATGAIVCRSGTCSATALVCIPAGGCAADGDCASNQFCNTQTAACTPKLPNGTTIPTIGGHTPPLTGTCTVGAGASVCASAVCDTLDNQCGYANGDGPCTVATGALVCRSGTCSVNGTCVPAGGCNVDGDCAGNQWCNISQHACAPKVPNGGVMPLDPAHQNPTVDGTCGAPAAVVVCTSAVCEPSDDRCGFANGTGPCTQANAGTVCRSAVCETDSKCGYENGHGPCTVANGHIVCRSGTCSPNGALCMPVGGCAVDADCGAGEWCNTQEFACKPRLPNGTQIPSVSGHKPPLTGDCSTPVGAAVCASSVCDATDDRCGYPDGGGPCTQATGIVVCRSGTCNAQGVCGPAKACTADADCDTATQYCDNAAGACAPKKPNGAPLPQVAGHTPALDGNCDTTQAPIVCQSAVCDAADDLCGLANGHGPCTVNNAGVVCRSSTCSPNGGVCVPSGGCAVDADCSGGEWCNTELFACLPKLPNGTGVPTVGGHTPPLTGACTPGAGTSVCQSGVCDTGDNKCGYANGNGPCTQANAGTVCREGACTPGGVCSSPTDCNVDGDCDTANQYCDTGVGKCAPKVPNGGLMPGVPGHTPSLDGTCSDAAAAVVCQSGVCDTEDNKCGHAIGNGPCTAGNETVVCRSAVCGTTGPNAGLCVECVNDGQCGGSTSVCDTTKNACAQCTTSEDDACVGSTPVCVPGPGTCAPCDGDLDSGTPHACAESSGPYCFLAGIHEGECGKCTSNADCVGHPGGPVCDTNTGACGDACVSDGDCKTNEWCNAPAGGTGSCVPKLDNGTHLPGGPPEVVTCTAAVGMRVCVSGACDPVDDTCGLKNGNGPCTNGMMCRSGACDPDGKCGLVDGGGPCNSDEMCRTSSCDPTSKICGPVIPGCTRDDQCKDSEFCKSDGKCTPKQDDGKACTRDQECKSEACNDKLCDSILASGNGIICAAKPGGSGEDGAALALLGIAIAGLARRRRR